MWMYVIICIPIFMTIFVVLYMPHLEKKTYSVEVFAEIIDYEEYATDAYGKMYVAVLKYSYNGEEYIVQEKKRKFREEDERYKYDVITLRIDPKRPENYMICTSLKDLGISKRDKMVLILVGIVSGFMVLAKIAPLISIIIFIIIAFVSLIAILIKSTSTKWVELDAKIVDTERKSVKGGTMLFHVYEYEYKGVNYRSMSNEGSACGKGPIGRTVKIKIDDKNPYIVKQDIGYKDLTGTAKFYIWASIIAIVVIVLMVMFF